MSWFDHTSNYFNDLSLTSNDEDRLDQHIRASQAAVEKYCSRTFESAEYDEIVRTGQDGSLLLSVFPVSWIARVMPGVVNAITIQHSTAQDASFSVTSTGVRLVSFTNGVRSNSNLLFASNVMISNLSAAIDALTGWTASADYSAYPSADLVLGQTGSAVNQNHLKMWQTTGTSYDCDWDWGRVTGDYFSNDQKVRVVYTAGFETIPEDLQRVVADLARFGYDQSSGADSEKLGDYEIIYANATEQIGQFGLNTKKILDAYKDRRI